MERVPVAGLSGYLTVKQVAEMLHITIGGVHKLIRRQNIPVVKLGNNLLLRAADIRVARD